MTTNTDPNGIAVSTLTGTRKQQVKTIAPMGAVTAFEYDALGQLLQSTDPCGYSTTYTYDMLGRMTQRVHPDAGTDTYLYDGAGNMVKHATQVLAIAGETVNYYYSYNRLDSIVYPDNTRNNVRYTYGGPTATHNQRGRIALLEDASGYQTFFYGRMGEVTENNRTFVLPNESYPYSFKMKYAYDSWNRIQNITYPDGEKVNYWYNTGGMLDSVVGKVTVSNMVNPKGGDEVAPVGPTPSTTYTYRYITHTTYNEFELKSAQWYGNNTRSQYTYDLLQRLSRLRLYNSANSQLQDITYTYDRVGNITRIQNTAGMVSSMGGQYNCRYTYDSLYRLVQATDTSYRGFKLAGRYEQRTSYFPDGRIQYKQDETWTNTSTFPFISNTYTYGNSDQPHTLTSTGNGINNPTYYTWDANGNMTKQGSNIYLQWDEENRLKSVSKPAQGVCFFYGASGERFYKNSGERIYMLVNGSFYMKIPYYQNPVLYTSPYMVVTPNGYTKHYYVESERFASRIGDGSISGINSHAASSAALAAKQADVDFYAPDSIRPDNFTFLRSMPNHLSARHTTYWQHSDHLGSASWVTDTNGLGYQHFQYRAWGEPFIEQNSTANGYETRYTFSGKERDEETGYSYFGARYYSSSLSIWLSVDPMSDKYPSLSPYTYCANNPVRLVDPDGREINPIFSTSGELLGTDSKGWKGVAIVMDKKNFKEGMNHKDALKKGTELNKYGKGINISDSDWKKVKKNGGERMSPIVENHSEEDIYFKPETQIGDFKKDGAYKLEAGKDLYMPIDGVATPKYNDNVGKIPTGATVEITKEGGLNIDFYGFGGLIRLHPNYGWVNKRWLQKQQKEGDHSWDKLFEMAGKIGRRAY